ncbi:alpha/beta fold hydrolase [Crocosphaera sp.]|uniref:condensation domain-containing protein n=1 Tax=Crocosphaera sp. TaxID=2729996 RepID=UPI002614072A|nr:alpha/beta fold hydrolase [Crocosphaera sp.]MDJ0579745.1 condensation domain-containing protein [Crocosphaera sp.]
MDKQNIEAIYTLTSLQQAFLWHSLQTSSQEGLLHVSCDIYGELNPLLLKQAWEFVFSLHPALRTSVHWQSSKQPLQVVSRQITLPWVQLDWQGKENQDLILAEFLLEDRPKSFDFTQAPISRISLIQLTDLNYKLLWSCHHLMLDGWSSAVVLNQVFYSYEILLKGDSPSILKPQTYQTYIRWLKEQDETAAANFWQKNLEGFTNTTPLPISQTENNNPSETENLSITISEKTTQELELFLRSHQLTVNTLVQGSWALLLYLYSGKTDVLFGATVSGRQADLVGIENIVGLLNNVLPVRLQITPEENIISWLENLQTKQTIASKYAYASLIQIQTWTQLSGSLFDSLLVIENYPMKIGGSSKSLQVDNFKSGIISTYNLTLIVIQKNELTVTLSYKVNYFTPQIIQTLLKQFAEILTNILQNQSKAIADILPLPELVIKENQSSKITSPSTPYQNLSREQLEGNFLAPENPTELKLTQIWESILGVSPLSVEASFFDLGGNSLMAVQLFNQMQQQLNCTLPLATLFQAPNVRKFAQLLNQEQPISSWTSVVPIQVNGSKLPFFFHGGSADALTWARFSNLLGSDQPFYALQRPDLNSGEICNDTVETLAETCVKEIRMIQPKGPYLIGGHCFGGAVAFEIVQQLQSQGEDIASLILIDAYCPNSFSINVLSEVQTKLQLGLFWFRKNYYYHGGWDKIKLLPNKVWQKLAKQAQSFPIINNEETEKNIVPEIPQNSPNVDQTTKPMIPYENRYALAQAANEIAANSYFPQQYSGKVKLFRAEVQTLDWHFGFPLGWQKVTKEEIEITTIPGFFGNLFNQESGLLLAEQVKNYLLILG